MLGVELAMKGWALRDVRLPEPLVSLLHDTTELIGGNVTIRLVLDAEATDLMTDQQEIILALGHPTPCDVQLGVKGRIKDRVLLSLKKLHLGRIRLHAAFYSVVNVKGIGSHSDVRITANDLAHRPRARDARTGTAMRSRGSVQPVC